VRQHTGGVHRLHFALVMHRPQSPSVPSFVLTSVGCGDQPVGQVFPLQRAGDGVGRL
jgi:hypothetical protein